MAGALFFGTLEICQRWGFRRWQAVIFAVLTTGNPIILVQIFSRMNDGLLACCLGLVAIYSLLFLTSRNFAVGAALTGVLIFALNLKFSALLVLGALSALICLMSFRIFGRAQTFWLGGMLLTAAVVGVFAFGAQPYLTNLFRYREPILSPDGRSSARHYQLHPSARLSRLVSLPAIGSIAPFIHFPRVE